MRSNAQFSLKCRPKKDRGLKNKFVHSKLKIEPHPLVTDGTISRVVLVSIEFALEGHPLLWKAAAAARQRRNVHRFL